MTSSSVVARSHDRRRRVRVRRLALSDGRALLPPDRAAVRLADAQDVRRVVGLHPVQHLHEQRVSIEQRRRSVAPLEPETPVFLLDVAHPELLAGEVEGLQDAGARHHPDVGSVGDRRRGRHVLLALPMIAVAEVPLPNRLTLRAIDGPQKQAALLCHVQENAVAPDNRRRSRPLRHRQLPRDVFGRGPLDGKVRFGADAVQRRPPPLRPVLRVGIHAAEENARRNGERTHVDIPFSFSFFVFRFSFRF